MNTDAIQFFRAWLANPLRVAAVAPSGQALARLMVAEIGRQTGPVIELGPGTGVFTQALLDRGVAPDQLVLIESGPEFVRILSLRFPTIRIIAADAATLPFMTALAEPKAGAVVSGLPLLSMRSRKVLAILSGVFRIMVPTGALYQFTYSPGCPVPRPILNRLGLRAVRIGFAAANLPPAWVYRVTRHPPKTQMHLISMD